jgi:predicted RNase H-like HicB family nuclease
MRRLPNKNHTSLPEIDFTVHVWKVGQAYVSYSPELDISTCGDSMSDARARLREAVSLFLEECSRQGTLDAILTESGFAKRGKSYRPRRILARAKVRLDIPLAS